MFHAVFILLFSFPFSKSKTLNFFNRSKTYVKLCLVYLYIYIVNIWSHNLVKTWLVFAYIKWQKCNCFAWDINKFLGTLWHVLTKLNHYWFPSLQEVDAFFGYCFTRYFFGGWNKSRKKRRPFAGYCFPGLCFESACRKMVYLMVTFEKEIPVIHFRFTHLSWLS